MLSQPGMILISISWDFQSLTANLLKICNAAYFGRRRISALDDAATFRGGENILRAVNVAGIAVLFKKGEGCGITAQDLGKHSVAAALMSRILMRRISRRNDSGQTEETKIESI